MKCKNCGFVLEEEWEVCPKCACKIEKSNDEENNNGKNNKFKNFLKQHGEIICITLFIISIILMLLINKNSISEVNTNTTYSNFLSKIRGISFLVALISIVTGFIKYPKNRIIKVLFILFLVGIVIYAIFIILMAIMCGGMFVSCIDGMASIS